MMEYSGIRLFPLEGGEPVTVPKAKTVIGRGSFLQVADKRVSRNHATLEINNSGQLIVIPIHTNPCFFKSQGKGVQVMLVKDQPKILNHGDLLALLPDKFFFRVVYPVPPDGDKGNAPKENKEKIEPVKTNSKPNKLSEIPPKIDKILVSKNREEVNSVPGKKRRQLPDWMVGAALRMNMVDVISKKSSAPKALPVASAKPQVKKVAINCRVKKPRKEEIEPVVPVPDEEEEEEEEDDEEEEEVEPPVVVKKRSQRPTRKAPKRKSRSRRDDEEDDEDDEDVLKPTRRPRAASLKKPKYNDDDFMISEEEIDLDIAFSGNEQEEKDGDSDFILDDNDEGSDWETKNRRSSKGKSIKTKKSRHSPSRKSHGRRTSSSGGSKRKSSGHRETAAEKDQDSFNCFIPRSSKRRAAVAAVSRMKSVDLSDYEEDDELDMIEVKTRSRSTRGGTRSQDHQESKPEEEAEPDGEEEEAEQEDDCEEEEAEPEDDEEHAKPNDSKDDKLQKEVKGYSNKRKLKTDCDEAADSQDELNGKDGKENYRATPSDGENKKPRVSQSPAVGRQKRAAALRQKEKMAAMQQESEKEEEEDQENHESDGGSDAAANESGQ